MDVLFVQGGQASDKAFWLLMGFVVVIGWMDGIVEGSFMGLALYLPVQYYQVSLFHTVSHFAGG